jgi:hypothetical protein
VRISLEYAQTQAGSLRNSRQARIGQGMMSGFANIMAHILNHGKYRTPQDRPDLRCDRESLGRQQTATGISHAL